MNPEVQVIISQYFILMVISKFHQHSKIDTSFICYLFSALAPEGMGKKKEKERYPQRRFKLGTYKSDMCKVTAYQVCLPEYLLNTHRNKYFKCKREY